MPGRVAVSVVSMRCGRTDRRICGRQADSHVRIVRLSSVEGRSSWPHADQGLDRAILNTPIVEGTRIVTRSDGLAEVEFEDQSALRLGENSEVKFPPSLDDGRGREDGPNRGGEGPGLPRCRAKGDDAYHAIADGNTFLIRRDTLARISAAPDQLQVAVLRGDVQLENQPQLPSVKKNETLTLDRVSHQITK